MARIEVKKRPLVIVLSQFENADIEPAFRFETATGR
jgi:hypothetical protein